MELCVDQPLDLKLNLTMGQAFRWTGPDMDGWFSGVVKGILIKIRRTETGLEFRSSAPEESVGPLLERYLRLDQDVRCIYNELSCSDSEIAPLVERYRGLRILRLEPWECLVSYICSNRNTVEGIQGMVKRLADKFGEPVSLEGVEHRAFPTSKGLAAAGEDELKSVVHMGSRAECIKQVATDVEKGSLKLEALTNTPYEEAKTRLRQYNGIGPKISDCVLLFSLDKPEAFPIDANVHWALVRWYGDRCFPGRRAPSVSRLANWGRERFGPNAGYAGQFLFHAIMSESD